MAKTQENYKIGGMCMVNVSVLITNGFDFLFIQNNEREETPRYSLPTVKTPTLIGAKRKIKQTIKDVGISFFIEKEIYTSSNSDNNTNCVYLCQVTQYISSMHNQNYIWLPIKDFESSCFEDFRADVKKAICNYINTQRNLVLEIKNEIEKFHDQSTIKLEFLEKINELQVFIFTPEYRCPFSFLFTFDCLDEEIEYQINWVLNQSIAPGNKSDIYILFSETMSLLLKLFLMEPVWVNLIEHGFIENEFRGAIITFESKEFNGITTREKAIEHAICSFEMFNLLMELHGRLIGSVSNKNIEKYDCNVIKCLNPKKNNYIIREEHACYFDDRIACISIDNGVYDSCKLLKNYCYEIIDGIHGKIVIQKKDDHSFYNFIDNDDWFFLQKIIEKRGIIDYKLICQSNRLYLVSENEIWVFLGCFHHNIAEIEKEEILTRNEEEQALLLANRTFSWKYPLNYARFEELCADLLEKLYPNSKIRLAGNSNNADGGRDIMIYNTDGTLYICQCKAYQKSVGKSDVRDIRDTIEFHGSSGFFLMVSSTITSMLIKHLELLEPKYKVSWWSEREIFKLLRRYPLIANRYKDIVNIH